MNVYCVDMTAEPSSGLSAQKKMMPGPRVATTRRLNFFIRPPNLKQRAMEIPAPNFRAGHSTYYGTAGIYTPRPCPCKDVLAHGAIRTGGGTEYTVL